MRSIRRVRSSHGVSTSSAPRQTASVVGTTEWVASIAASIDEIVVDASAAGASSVDGTNETVHAMTSDSCRATDSRGRDRGNTSPTYACQDAIACGETYETCLTNLLHRRRSADSRASPRALYTELRRRNPAYAAFLSVGTERDADTDTDTAADPPPIVVTCSSPERFFVAIVRRARGNRSRARRRASLRSGATPAAAPRRTRRQGTRGKFNDRGFITKRSRARV